MSQWQRSTTTTPKLEVHEHRYVRGARANRSGPGWPPGVGSTFAHSHEHGNAGHEHPDTGPGCYTIDKDEWYATTGLRGGGRKKFTKQPSGEQLEFVARTAEQQTFLVVFCDNGFTDEIARSTGLTQAEWERHRDEFKAAAENQVIPETDAPARGEGTAVANMALTFGMTPIYRYDGPEDAS